MHTPICFDLKQKASQHRWRLLLFNAIVAGVVCCSLSCHSIAIVSHSVSVYCGCFLDYHLCEQSYSFRCVEKSICHLVALRQQEQGLSRAVLLVERSLQKTACREERAAPCRKCELQVCGIDLQHGCSTVHIYICIYTHTRHIYICIYRYICM